jgi:hypothetical protein
MREMLARKNKTGGMENLSPSLSLKKSHLSPFFPYLRRKGSRLLWGGQKIKLIVFCLALTPSF